MSRANKVRFELRIEAALEQYDTCKSIWGEKDEHTVFALGKCCALLELYHDIYGYNYQGGQQQ